MKQKFKFSKIRLGEKVGYTLNHLCRRSRK